jgi:hypothetical protein
VVNNVVLEYFRSNRSKYPVEALKQKALAAGYNQKDIEEAIQQTNPQTQTNKQQIKPNPITTPTQQPIITKIQTNTSQILTNPTNKLDNTQTKEQETQTKNPLTNTEIPTTIPISSIVSNLSGTKKHFGIMAWAGILGLLFFILYITAITAGVYFQADLLTHINGWWALGIATLSTIYLLGFIKLGRKTKTKLITIPTYTRILLLFAFTILYIYIRKNLLNNTQIGGILAGLTIGLTIIWITTKYFFATGLIKQEKNIQFLKVVGILTIIYMSLISIGFTYFSYLYLTTTIDIAAMTILYWNFVIIEIFNISSIFFEAITLFYAHKKYE